MIYFIRHGESEANIQWVFAGQKNNSPLTTKWRQQAQEVGRKFKDQNIHIHKIISSPLIRAQQTAECIAQEIDINIDKIMIDDRLIEYDMGDLTSTPIQNISSAKLLSAQNAESINHFTTRIQSFLKSISKTQENYLIVSHAGVGRLIETMIQKIKPEFFYDLPAYKNSEIIELSFQDIFNDQQYS